MIEIIGSYTWVSLTLIRYYQIIAMEEHEGLKKKQEDNKSLASETKRYSSRKPWWLVIVMIAALSSFATYIGWLNSPISKSYPSLWAYLSGLRNSEIVPDSTLLLNSKEGTKDEMAGINTTNSETIEDSWNKEPSSSSSVEDINTDTKGEVSSSKSNSDAPLYYIKAGEFKTKNAALFRIRELRQGNYSAKLLEKQSSDRLFVVTVGEFKNYKSAQAKSQEINFILEIKSSVEEKN